MLRASKPSPLPLDAPAYPHYCHAAEMHLIDDQLDDIEELSLRFNKRKPCMLDLSGLNMGGVNVGQEMYLQWEQLCLVEGLKRESRWDCFGAVEWR